MNLNGVFLHTAGTGNPVPCPVGMWSNSTRLKSVEECQSCPGGFYCASTGLTKPTELCSDGYEPDFIQSFMAIQLTNESRIILHYMSQKVLLC